MSRTAIVALSFLTLVACGSGSSGASGRDVRMHLIAYAPDSLSVPVGTTITWTQTDAGFHTATSGTAVTDATGTITTHPDGKFDSGKLAQGKTFSHAFDTAGTYPYFCEIHPGTMHGRITAR